MLTIKFQHFRLPVVMDANIMCVMSISTPCFLWMSNKVKGYFTSSQAWLTSIKRIKNVCACFTWNAHVSHASHVSHVRCARFTWISAHVSHGSCTRFTWTVFTFFIFVYNYPTFTWKTSVIRGWPNGHAATYSNLFQKRPCGRMAGWPDGRMAAWPPGRLAAWPHGWPCGRFLVKFWSFFNDIRAS